MITTGYGISGTPWGKIKAELAGDNFLKANVAKNALGESSIRGHRLMSALPRPPKIEREKGYI